MILAVCTITPHIHVDQPHLLQTKRPRPPVPPLPRLSVCPTRHFIPDIPCEKNKKQTMTKETPSRRAGLVTFAGSVFLIGDATATTAEDDIVGNHIWGDRLSDEVALRKEGLASGHLLSRPVSEARPKLIERLFKLRPRGSTALGPALVTGMSMLKVTERQKDLPRARHALALAGIRIYLSQRSAACGWLFEPFRVSVVTTRRYRPKKRLLRRERRRGERESVREMGIGV